MPAVVVTSSCASNVCNGCPGSHQHKEGCCWRQDFSAPPLGATIAAHFRTQVSNGAAANMTFYDFDFESDSAQLNYRGMDRVSHVANLLAMNDFFVVIERIPQNPGLAEARRAAVVRELQGMGNVGARVVIGQPLAYPLTGVEAAIINDNFQLQTNQLGFPIYKAFLSQSAQNNGGGGAATGR